MSDAMKALQAKVGVTADGAFGPNTARAIAKHYELSPARAAHLLGQAQP
jgi:murein L,D-transpeptidase YcbB/YkuD